MRAEDDLSIVLASSLRTLAWLRCAASGTLPTASSLREALQALGAERDVLVDLREASFFDSTALAELIALYKRLNTGGRRLEALVGGSNMRRLLELTSLDGLIGVAPERAKYLNAQLPRPALAWVQASSAVLTGGRPRAPRERDRSSLKIVNAKLPERRE